jgi:hypothetical protein
MEISEAKSLLNQAKIAFDKVVARPSGVDPLYVSRAASMSADIAAQVGGITNAAGIKALMATKAKLIRFDDRAQSIINAGAEGKGGGDFEGPGIPPSNATGDMLIGGANQVIKVDKAFP